jgi:hypothetical protein
MYAFAAALPLTSRARVDLRLAGDARCLREAVLRDALRRLFGAADFEPRIVWPLAITRPTSVCWPTAAGFIAENGLQRISSPLRFSVVDSAKRATLQDRI